MSTIVKFAPNAKCFCGSGKKFKKCCGMRKNPPPLTVKGELQDADVAKFVEQGQLTQEKIDEINRKVVPPEDQGPSVSITTEAAAATAEKLASDSFDTLQKVFHPTTKLKGKFQEAKNSGRDYKFVPQKQSGEK